MKDWISTFLVKHLVDFSIGPAEMPEVGEKGEITVTITAYTRKLQLFIRWFGWMLKPLRWLP